MTADPHRDVAEALRSANIGNFRGTVRTENLASRPWASAGLIGFRYRFLVHFQGIAANAAATAFADGLAEREFALPGQIVADIAVVDLGEDGEVRSRLIVEALTVAAD